LNGLRLGRRSLRLHGKTEGEQSEASFHRYEFSPCGGEKPQL
jgi:hypothetical protein